MLLWGGGSFAVSLPALASAGVPGSLWQSVAAQRGVGAAYASALRGRTAFGCLSASATAVCEARARPAACSHSAAWERERDAAFRAARDRSSGAPPLARRRRVGSTRDPRTARKKTRLKSMSLERAGSPKYCPASRMRVSSPYKTSHTIMEAATHVAPDAIRPAQQHHQRQTQQPSGHAATRAPPRRRPAPRVLPRPQEFECRRLVRALPHRPDDDQRERARPAALGPVVVTGAAVPPRRNTGAGGGHGRRRRRDGRGRRAVAERRRSSSTSV